MHALARQVAAFVSIRVVNFHPVFKPFVSRYGHTVQQGNERVARRAFWERGFRQGVCLRIGIKWTDRTLAHRTQKFYAVETEQLDVFERVPAADEV